MKTSMAHVRVYCPSLAIRAVTRAGGQRLMIRSPDGSTSTPSPAPSTTLPRPAGRATLTRPSTTNTDVFAPCAAAALYRRDAFEDVAGFDEKFFCYFEDVDLAFRLRLRGYRCMYVHAAVVNHVSSGLSGYRSDFAVYHGERNMVWTFVKDMPGPLLWRYLPQHVTLNLAALLFYPWRGQGRAVWRAKFDAIRGLPDVLRQRRLARR